ncbi:MAG: phosphonate ABC transporter ATP-binding protein [Epsilonproteobacteria bacterium]|nr:MAG: phosphonate ABC transporter ATP-binding protein [Campylobacterota bacterium]RLA67014.1 MAG: phosphonate ABC transporter ATP-binding protein [Campylobacterota bacterium]
MLKVKKLNKIYPNGTHALKDISFEVKKGEFLIIIGLSGSGKSTLLRCLNRLIDPTSGSIIFEDEEISTLKGAALRKVRSRIGMVFQNFNLIPRFSVLKNTLTGSLSRTGTIASIFGNFSKEEEKKARSFLKTVGLNGKERSRADNLSGGQQQRLSMARALMQNPELLLADEPVASLDPATSHTVMDYLKKINQEFGVTIICNLHFLSLVKEYGTRVLALKDGEIVYEGPPEGIDEQWFRTIYGEDAKEVRIK